MQARATVKDNIVITVELDLTISEWNELLTELLEINNCKEFHQLLCTVIRNKERDIDKPATASTG